MVHRSISVVIPTYNREDLLPRAIESICRQSVPVKEIIVVDDGSTDNSLKLLAEIAAKEQKLKIVRADHGGANRARNKGIEIATGEWIAFLDSDDHWKAEKLEAQLAALDASPGAAASFTGMTMENGDGPQRTYIPKTRPTLVDLRCNNVLSSTSTAMVEAATLRAVGGFDAALPSCQDWDLWFRLRQVGELAVVQQSLVWIDVGPHARITTNKPSVIEGHSILFRRLKEGVAPGPQLRRIDASHKLVLADLECRAGRYRDGFSHALSASLTVPTKWGARLLAKSTVGVASQAMGLKDA